MSEQVRLMPEQLTIDCRPTGTGWRVDLRGELDLASAELLCDRLMELDGAESVVLDLRDLSFMDCSGLNVLISASRRARRHGGRLQILQASRQVRRLLELTDTAAQLGLGERGFVETPEPARGPGADFWKLRLREQSFRTRPVRGL